MTVEADREATATYTFTELQPGTFLYQSGSTRRCRCRWGSTVRSRRTRRRAREPAYAGAGSAYANEVVLLYSEIDVALHQAVFGGTYGTPAGPTSTIDY